MSDYRPMWTELGLDLERHDMLLEALGGMYQGLFLAQNNRPKAMDYFDFVVSEIHGLRVKELMDHRAGGGKVVGLYCVFVPEDLIMAAGAIPVGLCAGAQFAVPDAEEVLPRNTCPLVKSSFGFKVSRTCPYVQASDFVVGETTCDGKKKMYEILGEYHPTYVMEVPQKKTPLGREKGEWWWGWEGSPSARGYGGALQTLLGWEGGRETRGAGILPAGSQMPCSGRE